MDLISSKWQIGAASVLVVVLVGYAAAPTSAGGWTLCAAVAMTLPGIFAAFWRRPEPSLSESIRKALR
jgi:hypothetical protein